MPCRIARCLLLLLLACLAVGVRAQPSRDAADGSAPQAVAGEIDLRGWDFARSGPAPLNGQWRWYPGQFIAPGQPLADGKTIRVPAPWNSETGSAAGHGSYALTVQCRSAETLALLLPAQHSAATWYLNAELLHRQGQPGETAAQETSALGKRILALAQAPCPLRLVVHVSNHQHAQGGLVLPVELGDAAALSLQRGRSLAIDLALMGCFGLLGGLTLAFQLVRRREYGTLWFGLFCCCAMVYTGLANERLIERLVLPLPATTHARIELLAWYLAWPLLMLLMQAVFRRELQARPTRVLLAAQALPPLLALALPAPLFTGWMPALQWLTLAGLAWLLARLLPAAWQRREGAAVFSAGLVILVATVLADSLQYSRHYEWPRTSFGMLAFVMAAAAAMLQRLARALTAEELRGLEQRHRANLVVRATKAGILDWHVPANTVSYSERYCQMLGHTADADTSGWPQFFEQIHPEDRDKVREAFMRQLRDRSIRSGYREDEPMAYRLLAVDGQSVWVQAEGIALVGADGRTLRYICSFVDITHLKTTEQALATERERLRLLVRATKAGFGDWDARRDVVTYSDRFKEMLGYPADFDTSQWPSIFEMMHADDRDRARDQFRDMIRRKAKGGEQEPGEAMSYRLLRRDGSAVWIHADGVAQVDAEGRTQRFITSYLDVTHFHEQEEALRRSRDALAAEQRRLDLVVRGARVGIVDWDGRTHETYYSPRFREIRGYAPDADTGDWPDYFKVMIHPEDRERITRRWVTFIRGKGPEGPRGEYYAPEEYRLLRADGSPVWVQVSGIAVRDEQGFVQRWIAAIIDITERRNQEQALRDSHDQIAAQAVVLERQNEVLTENVRLREDMERIGRHDLKTPLNTIIAVPRLLRERHVLQAEDDELLGIVERAGLRILNLVNLSLDLYRMESGSYAFRPQPVDLVAVLRTVMADVQPHAATKRLQIALRVGGQQAGDAQTVHAWAEELLCYSILANLMKNAIEAAPEGSTIDVDIAPAEGLALSIALHNQGAVPEAVRERFFEKYATAGKSDGTGLGTYSAWLMARIQGGLLTMSTSEDMGTTLNLALQRATEAQAQAWQDRRSDEARAALAQAGQLPAMRVLAVDDDEYNLLVMRRYLPSPSLTVFTAVNGRAAIEAAQQHLPDLVLIDLDMPVMDGLEATRRLRALQQQQALPACRIVMLSSHDDEATRQRALQAGCDHYLCKPVSKQVLLQTLSWVAGQSPAPPEPELRAADGANRPDAAAAEHGNAGDAGSAPAADTGPPDVETIEIDPDLIDRLPAFLQSRLELLAALETAAKAGDAEALRRHAHRLAGSLSLYGLHWAAAQCRDIELAGLQ